MKIIMPAHFHAMMKTMARTLSTEIVNAAIEGLEARKLHIDQQIAELRAMLSGADNHAKETAPRKKSRMSAAGRKAIAEAQRRRWAAKRAGTTVATKAAP